MRGVMAASIAAMFAIALLTTLLIVNYGHVAPSKGLVRVSGRVSTVNYVLKSLTINGSSISISGEWRCSGINHSLSSEELINMIKPGMNLTVIAKHGFIGLKAVKVVLDSGTVCLISPSHIK